MVISTYVEMIPFNWGDLTKHQCDLHVCGDDPDPVPQVTSSIRWSPRMWRWSQYKLIWQVDFVVISTYVEMILSIWSFKSFVWCDLHVCGDDPKYNVYVLDTF